MVFVLRCCRTHLVSRYCSHVFGRSINGHASGRFHPFLSSKPDSWALIAAQRRHTSNESHPVPTAKVIATQQCIPEKVRDLYPLLQQPNEKILQIIKSSKDPVTFTLSKLNDALDFKQTFNRIPSEPYTLLDESPFLDKDAKKRTPNIEPPLSSVDGWTPVTESTLSDMCRYCLLLSKPRLTALVTATAAAGYMMGPGAFHPGTLALLVAGTTLCSASANTINQVLEVPYDSQMKRTQSRVLVCRKLSSLQAMAFASMAGTSGVLLLTLGANPLTGCLGLLNILLYTGLYTPLKRLSVYNTAAGAVVGGIPPLMGWAACAGTLDPGAWLMGAILFAWQFVHFNALSWKYRADYAAAGYRMMAVMQPARCRAEALGFCLALNLMCPLAAWLGVTSWYCALAPLPLNLLFLHFAWRFYREGDSAAARRLFMFSNLYLPALLVMLVVLSKLLAPNFCVHKFGSSSVVGEDSSTEANGPSTNS